MRIELDLEGSKLKYFQDLYETARAESDALYEAMERHYAQYKGSKELDGASTQAKVVRNITYELIESQVTSYIPNPAVNPKTVSDRNSRNAKSIETLLRNKRDELPFEKLNDMDERFNPIYGGSVWLIEWDESIRTHHTVGDVRVSCLAPKKFTGQPNIYEIADMEYCFIDFETTKDDIVRKYGVTLDIAEETESEENASGDDSTATLHVCYYKNDEDRVCQFIWSYETVLSDIDDFFARKRKVCKKCGKRREICSCENAKESFYELQSEEFEELGRDIVLSDGSVIPARSAVIKDGMVVTEMVKQPARDELGNVIIDELGLPMTKDVEVPKTEPTRLPFYRPSILPIVIRKNTSQEESLFGQSDCEFIRPQQQAINKVESRILEKLMKGGVYPMVPDDFQGELDNSLFEQVFRAKHDNYNLFGRIDLQVDISRDVHEADRLYDHAKRILGISDSFQGQHDSSAQSGKAKQMQIQQAAGRLDSKRQMKNAAYAEIDRIIFEYYLAYADEPRPASYRDAMGLMQNLSFNRYDFISRDEAGEYYYEDGYLFATDASVDVERQRELLWQENRQNFQQGAYGDPAQPETQLIFWLNMERAHYPFAHDNVERLRDVIERMQQAQQAQAGMI